MISYSLDYILVLILLLHLWQKHKQWMYVCRQAWKIVGLLKKLNALLHDHRASRFWVELMLRQPENLNSVFRLPF